MWSRRLIISGVVVLAVAIVAGAAAFALALRPPYTVPGESFDARLAAYIRLEIAAAEGRRREVRLWLAIGLDPNRDLGENVPPLIAAAGNGRLEVMKDLVARGADVNIALHVHDTTRPLDAAVQGGHREAVEYLLERGAFPGGVPGAYSPLQHAVRDCRPDLVRMLLAAGAGVDRTPFDPEAVRSGYRLGPVCAEIRAMLDPATRATLEPK